MNNFIDRSQNSLQIPHTQELAGNQEEYAVKNAPQNKDSLLSDKRIFFLGSSITYGAGSLGESFVDYLNQEDGLAVIKDTISGTTLAGSKNKYGESYVTRLRQTTPEAVDGIVVQLSTNDGRQGIPLGSISNSSNMDDLDWNTTTGAIEYIAADIKTRWHSKLAFYTCLREANDYDQLVKQLKDLQDKWHFTLFDLRADHGVLSMIHNDPETMVDDAHPTRKGYEKIWTPYFYKSLVNWLS